MNPCTWTVAEAKAKFSKVVEKARAIRPQTITRNDRTAVVVVSAEQWERKRTPRPPIPGVALWPEVTLVVARQTRSPSACSTGFQCASPRSASNRRGASQAPFRRIDSQIAVSPAASRSPAKHAVSRSPDGNSTTVAAWH